MNTFYRLTNRSTPTLSNPPTNTTTNPPPLPIKDDLQLENLRLTDQAFTPLNQRNNHNRQKQPPEEEEEEKEKPNTENSPSSSSASSSSSSKASDTTAPTTTTAHQEPNTTTPENQDTLEVINQQVIEQPKNPETNPEHIDHQGIGQAYQPPYQSYPSQNHDPNHSLHHQSYPTHHHLNHHQQQQHPPPNQQTYHHPTQFLHHQSHPSTSSLSSSFHYGSNQPPPNHSQSLPLRQFYPNPTGPQNHPALAIPNVHPPQQQQPYGGISYGIGPPGYRDNSYLPLNHTLSQPHGRPMFSPNPNLPSTGFGSSSSTLSGLHQSSLARSGTSLSHSSSHSNMITASNLSARPLAAHAPPKPSPTITKQSIDEYRNRIKSDPDPEAHFNYAKFLIEAAKKLASGGAAGDDKAIKKYRDALLQESLKLIKKLATQGVGLGKPAYSDAQFFLANCLGNGSLGLHVDHEKAYNLYVQASKQNHPAATYRTAVCNELGAGTRKDGHRAMLFYRKASALGDTAGMYKLGMILLNGLLGQQKNPQEALLWLKRAAQQADEDNPHALHELAQLYEKPPLVPIIGQPSNPAASAVSATTTNATTPGKNHNTTQQVTYLVQRDEGYARELYTQAAQLGYPASQNRLGACYEYGALTCAVDPRRSIGWYTKAAERGDAESELALSGWYLTGSDGVLKQSDSEAYLWARRAASKGLPKAEYAVGYYSEVGIGVKQDLEEAKRWYMRAATNKNKRAMQRLTELKKMGAQKPGKKQARPTRDQAASECLIV